MRMSPKHHSSKNENYCTPAVVVKGVGSHNCKQTCYLHALYCCPNVVIVFCTDFGGWGESTIKLLLKIHQFSTIVLFVSVQNVQNSTFILRKVVETSVILPI